MLPHCLSLRLSLAVVLQGWYDSGGLHSKHSGSLSLESSQIYALHIPERKPGPKALSVITHCIQLMFLKNLHICMYMYMFV